MAPDISVNSTITRSPIENLLIACLSPKVRSALDESLTLVKLRRGQIISCEGSDTDYVYFPESCVISESKSLEDGRMLELSLIGREGAAGLIEQYLGEHTSVLVRRVIETGFAYRITGAALRNLQRDEEQLKIELSPYVNTYLRHLGQQSACASFHSARQRMSLRLMMIYKRTSSLRISATHEELAHALGVFRPTVSILSQKMRDDGLIANTRGKFQIEDPDRLRVEACGCYGQLWPAMAGAYAA